MSKVSSSTDNLLYTERGLRSSKTTLFPEDHSSSPFKQVASYSDPDWTTNIVYDHGNPTPTPYSPHPTYNAPFGSRDLALAQEYELRIHRSQKLPTSDRHRGNEDKVLKTAKPLLQKTYANYSAKPVYDFKVQMTPTTPLLKRLGIEDFGKDHRKLSFSNKWHKNGLKGYQFWENGKLVTLHDTVTSSNDRSAYRINMMRRVDSEHTGQSISYTGRPDTEHKAIEQIEFIFRSEIAKGKNSKGIKINKVTGEYELTYVVTNLMSAVGATGLVGLNEKKSILREQQIFNGLKQRTLTIDGKKVHVKPIYFNQGFSSLNDAGVPKHQKKINVIGHQELKKIGYEMLKKKEDPLLRKVLGYLERDDNLLPEEGFFYRDLVCKLLELPVVIHCKSSTDRTATAIALSMATHQWMNCKKIPNEARPPHSILSDAVYKELFMSNVMSCHQITRVSRSAEGAVERAQQFSQLIGFNWGANGVKKNYIALRMAPERYKREGKRPTHIAVTLFVLKFLTSISNWKKGKERISYLKKAYIKKEFDLDSNYIKERRLFKPSKTRLHYEQGATHPRDRVSKSSKFKLVKRALTRTATDIALGTFGFFDAIFST